MLKEQQKQDKQLDLIQRLEKELKSSEAKPALSVFELPVDVETNRGIDDMVNHEVNGCFKTDGGKLVFPMDDARIVEHEEDSTNNSGIVSWLRRGDWERVPSDEVQSWEVGHAYMSKLLEMLAPIIDPNALLPSDTTNTSTAMALLKVVFGQTNKGRANKGRGDNWSKFLRLRGAWNDQDEAKDWVTDGWMLDFDWDVTLQEPARFGVDFGQSMEPVEVREEQRKAKYWWIDIPDLTGLVLKILLTLERQRKKQLKIRGVEPKPARSVGKSRELGGGAAEALEAPITYTEEVDLNLFKTSSVKALVDIEGWTGVDAKQYVEDNGASIKSLKKALKKASHK